MRKFIQNQIIVISVIAMSTLMLSSFPTEGVQGDVNAVKQVTLKIEGMTCPLCAPMIRTALKKLNGVVGVDVNYNEARAKISYQEGKVTLEQIIESIYGIGMKAYLIDEGKK
jgi:Cu2+-exporting ATPase